MSVPLCDDGCGSDHRGRAQHIWRPIILAGARPAQLRPNQTKSPPAWRPGLARERDGTALLLRTSTPCSGHWNASVCCLSHILAFYCVLSMHMLQDGNPLSLRIPCLFSPFFPLGSTKGSHTNVCSSGCCVFSQQTPRAPCGSSPPPPTLPFPMLVVPCCRDGAWRWRGWAIGEQDVGHGALHRKLAWKLQTSSTAPMSAPEAS